MSAACLHRQLFESVVRVFLELVPSVCSLVDPIKCVRQTSKGACQQHLAKLKRRSLSDVEDCTLILTYKSLDIYS